MTESLDWADLEAAGLHIPVEYQPRVALALRLAETRGRVVGLREAAEIAAQKSALLPHQSDMDRGYALARGDATKSIRALADKIEKGDV
jgi:hypothetical protein